jgi:hypothetical protein
MRVNDPDFRKGIKNKVSAAYTTELKRCVADTAFKSASILAHFDRGRRDHKLPSRTIGSYRRRCQGN